MSDPGAELPTLRQAEHVARTEVTRLRRRLYDAADPASAKDALYAALAEAESRLDAAASARERAQSRDVTQGLIVDTAHDSQLLGARSTGLEVKMTLRMEHLPTAIAHLMSADRNPLVRCEVRNAGREGIRRLRVTSFVEGFSASAVDTIELDAADTGVVEQLPVLQPEPARAVSEMTRATLNVLVEDLDTTESRVEVHRSIPIWLLARTSAPLAVRDASTGEWHDTSMYFGAFVTPNAPELMTFLRKAAVHHSDGALIGYQGDDSKVEPQVEAIFTALKEDAQIAYVNSVLTSSPDEGFADQRVRLPRESLADGQGNCIDGTVLFASMIEAISMNPAIVVVPGHAFVAWETWTGSDRWSYLETTMTDSHTFAEAREAGERTAAHYSGGNGSAGLRRFALRTLRAQHGITPMG